MHFSCFRESDFDCNRKKRAFSFRESFFRYSNRTDHLFYNTHSQSSISSRNLFARQSNLYMFYFRYYLLSVIAFGKCSSGIYVVARARIWLCVFCTQKKKEEKEKRYEAHTTCRAGYENFIRAVSIAPNTSGTILFLYLRKWRPTCAARYFSRGKLHYGVIARDESPP